MQDFSTGTPYVALLRITFENKEKFEVEIPDLRELFYKLDLYFEQIFKMKSNSFFVSFQQEKDLRFFVESLDDFFIEEPHATIQVF